MGRGQAGRGNIPVPGPIDLHATHTGERLGFLDVINTITAKCLGVQAVEITLSEGLGVLFVLAGDQQGRDRAALQPLDKINGDNRATVLVALLPGCLTGQLIGSAA